MILLKDHQTRFFSILEAKDMYGQNVPHLLDTVQLDN